MVAPLNFGELDNLAVCDSAGKLENLHWFLLVSRNGMPATPDSIFLAGVLAEYLSRITCGLDGPQAPIHNRKASFKTHT